MLHLTQLNSPRFRRKQRLWPAETIGCENHESVLIPPARLASTHLSISILNPSSRAYSDDRVRLLDGKRYRRAITDRFSLSSIKSCHSRSELAVFVPTESVLLICNEVRQSFQNSTDMVGGWKSALVTLQCRGLWENIRDCV